MTTLELAQTAKKIIDRKKPQSEQETVLPLALPEKPPQQLAQNVPGNIDLSRRPVVENSDGSKSTVRSMSFDEDGQEVLVPTVVGDKVVSDDDAIRHYRQSGQHLGKFNSVDNANAAGDAIHRQQEIRGIGGWPQPQMMPVGDKLQSAANQPATPIPTPVPQPSMAGMKPGTNEMLSGLRRVRPDLFKPQQPPAASPGPNPEMVKIESQLNAMDQPQKPPTLIDRAKAALEGFGRYGGMNPVQAQQLEQNSRQTDADNQFRKRQELAQRAKAIMEKEHRDTQDAFSRRQMEMREEAHPIELQTAQAKLAQTQAPLPRKFGQRDVEREGKKYREYFDEQNPGMATDSIELGPIEQPKPVPGRDVPLPPDVEAQRGRMNAPRTNQATQDRRVDNYKNKFGNEPIVKTYNKVTEALQFARTVPEQNDNPAYDQALIYAFAKAMDPESVVREGEYATVQKYAQSWANNFRFNAERVLSNTEFLTPEARKNMKTVIEQRAAPIVQQYGNLRKQYAGQIGAITGDDGDSHLIDYGAAFEQPASDAGGVPAVGGTFNGGKVLKVTPIQ